MIAGYMRRYEDFGRTKQNSLMLSSGPLPATVAVIVSSRSINALIWALMLVTIIGPGVFAGIIAIALRSIGFFAKLLYEAIEEIDEGQVDAVRATGASGAR